LEGFFEFQLAICCKEGKVAELIVWLGPINRAKTRIKCWKSPSKTSNFPKV